MRKLSYFRENIANQDEFITFANERAFFENLKKNSEDHPTCGRSLLSNTSAQKMANILSMPQLIPLFEKSLSETTSQKEAAISFVLRVLEEYATYPREELLSISIRGAAAILTNGVVTVPYEGISQATIVTDAQGNEYIDLKFSGPIRAAGGTTMVTIVAIAGFLREKLKVGLYRPTPEEVERYLSEIDQYVGIIGSRFGTTPAPITKLVVESCPVCINGQATEREEVKIHKYLPRVSTPRVRGGMAIVILDGIIGKAKKSRPILKQLGVEWPWVEEVLALKASLVAEKGEPEQEKAELTMGRPLLSLEGQRGGLRYRVAKSSNNGLSAALLHPDTFDLIGFINIGSQLKTWGRWPKGATLHACTDMAGPIVEYSDGIRRYVPGTRKKVLKILDLGQIGYALGEHINYNYSLRPRDYCSEVWRAESKLTTCPTDAQALLVKGAKLHPHFNLMLGEIKPSEWIAVRNELLSGGLPNTEYFRQIMRRLAAECDWTGDKIVALNPKTFGHHFLLRAEIDASELLDLGVRNYVNGILSSRGQVPIGQKGDLYFNGRVGRAESVRYTKLKPPINGIAAFPATANKPFWRALSSKSGTYYYADCRRCNPCDILLTTAQCETCGQNTVPAVWCDTCNKSYPRETFKLVGQRNTYTCPSGHETRTTHRVFHDFQNEFKKLVDQNYPGVAGELPKITVYKSHVLNSFEPFAKTYLRALYKKTIARDGLPKLNMMNLITTRFTPRDANVSVSALRRAGYLEDIHGKPLEHRDQELNLKVNDLLMPLDAYPLIREECLFIDRLIEYYYKGPEKYFDIASMDDLVGVPYSMIAPHISCAFSMRIVGWAAVKGVYRHPVGVAACRRNCDGDQDGGVLTAQIYTCFSKEYSTTGVGGHMGSPIIQSDKIAISEVDDEVHYVEYSAHIPQKLLDNTRTYSVREIKTSYEAYGSLADKDVHRTYQFRTPGPVICLPSAANLYKDINDSFEKYEEVVDLQKKLLVSNTDYYSGLLKGHILRDCIGNANAFFKQSFLCRYCGAKFEFPPISRKCIMCHTGEISLTVTKKMVTKYVKYIRELIDKVPLELQEKCKIVEHSLAIFQDSNPFKTLLGAISAKKI